MKTIKRRCVKCSTKLNIHIDNEGNIVSGGDHCGKHKHDDKWCCEDCDQLTIN